MSVDLPIPDDVRALQTVLALIAQHETDVTGRKEHIAGLSPDTAGWEEFENTQKRLDEIRRQLGEVDTYMREVIDPARDRLRDSENPMTPDEPRPVQRAPIHPQRDDASPPARSRRRAIAPCSESFGEQVRESRRMRGDMPSGTEPRANIGNGAGGIGNVRTTNRLPSTQFAVAVIAEVSTE